MDQLIDQLPSPFFLGGDFNTHSDLWGCIDSNHLGKIMESVIEKFELCLLNDNSNTYLHPPSGSFSAIDLSICSPTVYMDFGWRVTVDQCGSDHFPIFIDIDKPLLEERTPKWQQHKANWAEYNNLCLQSMATTQS